MADDFNERRREYYTNKLVSTINLIKSSEGLNKLLSEGKILVTLDNDSEDPIYYGAIITPTYSLSELENKSIPFYLYQLLDSKNFDFKIRNDDGEYSWKTDHITYEFSKAIDRRLQRIPFLDVSFDSAEGLLQKYNN